MVAPEHVNYVLVITTSCLAGIALIFLSARVALQKLKHCDIWWDGLALITSWVGSRPFSIIAHFRLCQ